jgi:hypothetical protein
MLFFLIINGAGRRDESGMVALNKWWGDNSPLIFIRSFESLFPPCPPLFLALEVETQSASTGGSGSLFPFALFLSFLR